MARKLSEEHLNLYLNGPLSKLFQVVQEDPELAFEIRNDNSVKIYYRKKKLLTIKGDKKSPNKLSEFISSDYYKKTNPEAKILELRYEDLIKKDSIRSYFDQAKKYAYQHSYGAEFELQQNVMLSNSSLDNRYLAVDMEWAFPQQDISEEERISRTRIDLLIVDLKKKEANQKYDFYITEVKLGAKAIDGPSGIQDHIKKSNEIINNENACNTLRNDIQNIIAQKKYLGIISGNKDPKEIILEDKPKIMLLLAYRSQREKIDFENKIKEISTKLPSHYMNDLKIIYYNMFSKLEEKE